jgi:multimeric flavodoxin WrbA
MYCKSHDGCKQEDDMIPLIEKIKKADRLVLGSPIYIGYITGQAKVFLDRLYVFSMGPNSPSKLPAGKKAALVFSQGHPDEDAFKKYIEMVPRFLGMQGIEITDTLFAAGVSKAADDEALMQRAFQIGIDLVK